VLERRLEFLRLEAKGFTLCETVKILSEKYQTSERNIYYDAETRETWQPVLTQLFELDKARLILVNRYDYLYRMASLHFQSAADAQKPAYLSKMVDITDRIVTLLGLETLKEKQDRAKRAVEFEREIAENGELLKHPSLMKK
jgi:RNase P subunit RPR2